MTDFLSDVTGRAVLLIGGGGHAAVCLDVFETGGREVIGYLAPSKSDLVAPYLGDDAAAESFLGEPVDIFVAIGHNRTRRLLLDQMELLGCSLATAVSERAVVSRSALIGPGSLIMPGAIINARTSIGRGAIVNTGATVDHDCMIGEVCHIAPGCHLAGNVTLGEGVLLGIGAVVVPGRAIGAWATVGAGAAVTANIAGAATAVGVPARVRTAPSGVGLALDSSPIPGSD